MPYSFFSRTESLSYNKEVIIMLKFEQLLVGSVVAGITRVIFGLDAGTLMLTAVMVGCILYNVYAIYKRKA